jgi:hypothetical protein
VNGRVARALTNAPLVEAGYEVVRWVSLEQLIAETDETTSRACSPRPTAGTRVNQTSGRGSRTSCGLSRRRTNASPRAASAQHRNQVGPGTSLRAARCRTDLPDGRHPCRFSRRERPDHPARSGCAEARGRGCLRGHRALGHVAAAHPSRARLAGANRDGHEICPFGTIHSLG